MKKATNQQPTRIRRQRKTKPIWLRWVAKVKFHGLDGCWIWQGGTRGGMREWDNGGKYGVIRIGRREDGKVAVHRWVLEEATGKPIPDGLVVDHLCRHRLCCNPLHLEAVTVEENTRRSNQVEATPTEPEEWDGGDPFADLPEITPEPAFPELEIGAPHDPERPFANDHGYYEW